MWSRGPTAQFVGRGLPLTLSPRPAHHGTFVLLRKGLDNYQNKALHAWIGNWIYEDVPVYRLFTLQFILAWWRSFFSSLFDPEGHPPDQGLRYGRRLKGSVLVNAKQFTKAVAGTGIGPYD